MDKEPSNSPSPGIGFSGGIQRDSSSSRSIIDSNSSIPDFSELDPFAQ